MFNDPKRSTPARPQVVNLLRQIRAGEAVAGVHEFRAAGHGEVLQLSRVEHWPPRG